MDAVSLILEVKTRSLNHYYQLEQFPVRVGRALDNDIILSDTTVSPHHLEIEQLDGFSLRVRNLSGENGSRMNRRSLRQDEAVEVRVEADPVSLRLGNRQVRLLRSDMDVSRTSVRNCSGLYAVFCRPAWSLSLMVLTLLAFLYENYLQARLAKDITFYLGGLMPYLLGLVALTLVIAGISRLSTQRWEVGPALSLASLFMIGPHVLGEIGHFLNYLLTADWPLEGLMLVNNFLLLPVVLYGYIRLVHHAESWSALGVALLFSTPMLVYQMSDLMDQIALDTEFTGEADFNRTLSSLDIRLQPSISIDDFVAMATQELGPFTAESDAADESE
ncbi:MAG: FHA domain-containing protein [Thiothrix sp.]|nr:FHA domain-containing protein [Thiothrix sp.]HPQ95758.1 FHA domain-containing protein [Thiolinea sp.]